MNRLDHVRPMAGKDWKTLTKELREKVCLATAPVAIKLLPHARQLLDYPDARLLTATTPCHMAAIARYDRGDGLVGASGQGVKCLWGACCFGLIRTPDRVAEGDINLPFVQDVAAAQRLHGEMHMLGNKGKRYDGVLMAPLDLAPFEPDVIAIYLSPAKALRLIIAFAYRRGEAVVTRMTGQASLCSGVARAVDENEVTMDIPCMGDRAYGLVQESEVLVVFPASRMEELMEGLEETEPVASYPFRPFLRWMPIFPPSWEPRNSDAER